MNKSEAIKALDGKTVFIWGARMTGLGALRKLRAKNINVSAFIDSDPALKGIVVNGVPVKNISEIENELLGLGNPAILVAVALKEEEIILELEKRSLSNIPIFSFQDPDEPYYTIDILSSCNLKCLSCPHSIENHGVPKGSMRLDTFKSVLDKIVKESPSVSHISLYSWGEPLLHPQLSEIVEYIHKHDIAVALSSNLSIRFDERIDELIKLSPEYLKVSVSGYYPDVYNNTHQGGDVNLVKSNLYRLRYLLDKYSSTTLVDINYHLYRDNCGKNYQKFQDLANELGFAISKTFALVMPLERVISYYDGVPNPQTEELQKNLLVTIDEGVEASTKIKLPKGTCPFRENQININADLSVPICCTTFQRGENIIAPNYLTSDINQINLNKKNAKICGQCMDLGLPEYNMGFNRPLWEKFASEKKILD